MRLFKKKNLSQSESKIVVDTKLPANNDEDNMQEIAAVIGVALGLYKIEVHDYEQMVLTIQKVMRPYSPWSSKIYGLRQYPIKTRNFNYEKIQTKNSK